MSDDHQTGSPLVWRVKRSALYLGTISLIVFGTLGVILCAFARHNNGELLIIANPIGFLFPFAIFLFFVSISLYLIAAYFRQRVTIDGDEVIVRWVFRTRKFRFSEVTELDWGLPRTQLVIRLGDEKLKIESHDYEHEDLDRVVYFFRTGVPEDRQKNWHKICYMYSKRTGSRDVEREPPDASKGEVLITRHRYDVIFGVGMILALSTSAVLWFGFHVNLREVIGFPLVLALLWIFIHFSASRKGYIGQCIFRRSESSKMMRPMLISFLPVIALVIAGLVFSKYEVYLLVAAGVAYLVSLAFIMKISSKQEQERREKIEQFAMTGDLRPEAVFGHLDGDGEHEVE
ncbi:MAG: hypothetical protein PVH19_11790 [Planctomycetia bacterium]